MKIMDVTKEICRLIDMTDISRFGVIAQLVEHLHGMQGVSGSSPLGSIKIFLSFYIFYMMRSRVCFKPFGILVFSNNVLI